MKLGLIARADDRGLGHITLEVHRHLRPDRVLVVDMGRLARGFAQRHSRYADAPESWTVTFDGGQLPAGPVCEFLDGLDVVYSAETFYDPALVAWAESYGVATVLHVMPEFFHPEQPGAPAPTAVWAPTRWRLDHLPERTRLVPVPVALDRFPSDSVEESEHPVRWLHVAGHRAAQDRNGTLTVYRALRHLRRPCSVAFQCQDVKLPTLPRPLPRYVTTTRRLGPGQPDYWQLYATADALVLPRRYGGLCLPAQEAMAAGLAVLMPDVEPNREWPAVVVPARVSSRFNTASGSVAVHDVDPVALAHAMDDLADPAALAERRRLSREWAIEHSWETLAPTWRGEFDRALAG